MQTIPTFEVFHKRTNDNFLLHHKNNSFEAVKSSNKHSIASSEVEGNHVIISNSVNTSLIHFGG